MPRPVLIAASGLAAGCQVGTLESGEWGKLRYFGELTGTPEFRIDDEATHPLELLNQRTAQN